MTLNTLKVLGIALLLGGCAVGRGELDVRLTDAPDPAAPLVVKLTAVKDLRKFEVDPELPSIPSLKEDEVNDRSVEMRAIARKRNAYGAALGDIVLPQGRTVEQLTTEALVKGLRESGISVASVGDPTYATARPLQAEITQFWGWFTPGFFDITLQYEASVTLKGDWPVGSADREIKGKAVLKKGIAATSEWQELFTAGLNDLIGNLKRILKPPMGKPSAALEKPVS